MTTMVIAHYNAILRDQHFHVAHDYINFLSFHIKQHKKCDSQAAHPIIRPNNKIEKKTPD